MNAPSPKRRLPALLVFPLLLLPTSQITAAPQTTAGASNPDAGPDTVTIDLPTVLRLANARNLDVQIARERLQEARAAYDSAVLQFLPWLAPGITYRRHDNLLQDVGGNILDVHKDSYAPGLTMAGQVDLGDATYRSLAARQTARAAIHAVDAQRQVSILAAVQGYYDLVKAQGRIGVAQEAQRIAENLHHQLAEAVSAGIAYKGDELRAQIQTGQSEMAVRQAIEEQHSTGARLVQILHLDSAVELSAHESELMPLALIQTNIPLSALLEQALRQRPELELNQAQVSAAKAVRNGATYGPLIPTLGGAAYVGGLGGGADNGPSRFGESEDYTAYLAWRVGPGGLLDFGRSHQAKSQWETARLTGEKVRDEIVREVMEDLFRFRSLREQLNISGRTLAVAVEAQKLAEQRKEFAVGAVLEAIQTQQDLTRARNDYLTIVAEFNKAQYALQKATGNILYESDSRTESTPPPPAKTAASASKSSR